ncbi:uncharacterized protein LOC130768854 [Actinidia eriantha]|uniref:uncharacterized protein LOC130768854 n=1 Tax=Actinidia eriantha TaxID=165200 RepID=UPI0025829586|nr:uncharacterized protein LOC130768854 [Actinidia eriantha]
MGHPHEALFLAIACLPLFELLAANGRLRRLALINCAKIADDGLLQFVEQNHLICKICRQLNGICNVKKEHLDTLHSILGTRTTTLRQQEHPIQHSNFYHKYKNFTAFKYQVSDHDHPIDIDICPKCDQARMPYCNHAEEQQCSLPGSSGFVCDACQMEVLRSSYN